MIAAVFAVIYFSNQATSQAGEELSKQKFSLAVTDESGIVKPEVLKALSAKQLDTKEEGVALVKEGKLDGFIFIPKDLGANEVQIYGKDVGIFDNNRYASVTQWLLSQSIDSKFNPSELAVVQQKVKTEVTTYQDGVERDAIKEAILPGVFLILLYLLITTFGGQMLASTTEEKENRVIEMILTTVRAKTLIVGKIVSMVILGFLQMAIVLIPVIVGYALLHTQLALPTIDLSELPVDWVRIGIGFVIFVLSFLLLTGLLVAIGAATPTAKEANSFFGVIMLLMFGPLYAVTLFVSSPDAGIVQFLSYFPFTAPIPLLLRNAVGNLELYQALISMVILAVSSMLVMMVAVRAFRYGALEYSRKLTLKEIFAKE
jgi:ABC-2 type transport system permease protein